MSDVIRFVTIVTPDFWPGFAALVQSLTENSGLEREKVEFAVLCDENLAPHVWLAKRQENIRLFPMHLLPKIEILSSQNQGVRMENALQKLGIFNLPREWGKCIYIDADIICLRKLEGIQKFPSFTVAFDEVVFGVDVKNKEAEYNTGLFVFNPDEEVFHGLQQIYLSRHAERTHKGDQDIFNLWVKDWQVTVTPLSSEWNFSKRYQDSLGKRKTQELFVTLRLLHFVGAKPWTPNKAINTSRESHYYWMEKIWWDYFERSGFREYWKNPVSRSQAWRRRYLLSFTKPTIIREHFQRVRRFVQKSLGCRSQNE